MGGGDCGIWMDKFHSISLGLIGFGLFFQP